MALRCWPHRQIGRGSLRSSAELEVLTGLLDDVEVSGAALVLRGDPGIGKSRLLSEAIALAEARGMSVLATRGVQSEARLAFAGLQQLLRPVRPQATGLTATHQAVLDAALGIGDDQAPEHFRIALAVLDLLSDASTDSPLLLARRTRTGWTSLRWMCSASWREGLNQIPSSCWPRLARDIRPLSARLSCRRFGFSHSIQSRRLASSESAPIT